MLSIVKLYMDDLAVPPFQETSISTHAAGHLLLLVKVCPPQLQYCNSTKENLFEEWIYFRGPA